MTVRADLGLEAAAKDCFVRIGLRSLNIVKTFVGNQMNLDPGRNPHQSIRLAVLVCFLIVSSAVFSADQMCFLPVNSSGGNSDIFVEPKSKVCRAFQRELNANCAGEIPTVEFKPKLRDSGLTEPAWQSIALYAPGGTENPDAFTLLEKLIWSRATTGYSIEQGARATRDVNMVLGQVRAAHADNRTPRFDKVSLDLEGRGHEEVLYRLYSGLMRNPTSINDQNSSFKSEPHLLLDRAIGLAGSNNLSNISSHAAGNDVTRGPAEVLLFDGVPYFLTWSADHVLVYASYLQPNRPKIPDETFEDRTFIIPQLRCMFESRQNH